MDQEHVGQGVELATISGRNPADKPDIGKMTFVGNLSQMRKIGPVTHEDKLDVGQIAKQRGRLQHRIRAPEPVPRSPQTSR